jgi:hypothetical protein
LLAYWRIARATGRKLEETDADKRPLLPEDVRLMLLRPIDAGALAWLWDKIRPRDERREDGMPSWYIAPDDRLPETAEAVAALFVVH